MQASSVQILKNDAQEEKCEMARMSLFIGAVAIGDLVKSTLGPKGMDKILVKGGRCDEVCITNDGAKILSSIGVDNPSAKILVDVAKTQDKEIGDGTTSVVVLASELLKEAEKLIYMGIHPQTIISSWNKCVVSCDNSLKNMSFDCMSTDENLYKQHLKNLAKVTLSSKVVSQHMSKFVDLTVNAILRIKDTCNIESINILKKLGGCLEDSYLDDGFILDKKIGLSQPKKMLNAKILLANTSMDADKVKVFGSRIKVDSTSKVAEIELMEKQKMKNKVNKILAHNINCFINRQLIYNYPEQLFSDSGVMAIEHADFEGIERLAAVLGGDIVSTFDDPTNVRIGKCDLIEEIMIGEDKVIKFSGVPVGEACTIVLRGASNQILDEAERAIHDALCVLSTIIKDSRMVYGGGAAEIKMAVDVSNLANQVDGKESIAITAFANALKQLPTAVADNSGLDSCDLIPRLCTAYASNTKCSAGIDINNSSVGDMASLGIVESFKAKRQVVQSASEAAIMILRVDEIIKAAPRKRTQRDHHC